MKQLTTVMEASMKRILILSAILAIGITGTMVLTPAGLQAAVPNIINFQGRLDDSTGAPLDTLVNITFSITATEVGGIMLWQETHVGVSVSGGLFTVELGSVDTAFNPLDAIIFNAADRWVDIEVNGEQMSPRTRLVTTPFAFRVATVDGASGGMISGDLAIQSDLVVDGNIESQTITLSSGAADGSVLTSDATGAASWQASSIGANPWIVGGTLEDLVTGNGELTAYPPDEYMYGLRFVGRMIHEAVCTKWNVGLRFYNLHPIFVQADNPQAGMKWGGFMFYINTNATDDDACSDTNWKHQYWSIDPTTSLISSSIGSVGCVATDVWVRQR